MPPAARHSPARSADRTRPAASAFLPWVPMRTIPLFQQFSLGVQQQVGNDWLLSADGLHVFATRQIIGQFLRSTDSTSPYVSCPGSNVPCSITDPLSGITDNITLLQSQAKSWYDGLDRQPAAHCGQARPCRLSIQRQLHSLQNLRLLRRRPADLALPRSRSTWWRASTICAGKRATP